VIFTLAAASAAQSSHRQFQGSRFAPVVQSRNWEVDELVSVATRYINQYWRDAFARGGVRNYVAPAVYRSTRRLDNALYVPSMHAIYYDYNFFNEQMRKHGDFAVVTILAHEWGHAMQHLLNANFSFAIERELQADCYAGAFARSESFTTRLESTDIPKAISALMEAGDHPSVSILDGQAHGTAQKRTLPFRRGYGYGLSGCTDRDIARVAVLGR
jgi:predicted metalloprotease